MAVTFDERSPIYRQIAERIKEEILRGELGPDEPTLSTNQYAAFFRINPATAARAFQELVDEGVLYKRRGVGMFVSAQAAERLREQRRTRFVAEHVEPLVAEAARLGIPLDDVLAKVADVGRSITATKEQT